MVKFLGNKNISFKEAEDFLTISDKVNHYVNNGPVKGLLERKLEKLLDLQEDKRVVCVTNGTAALHSLMFLCQRKHNVKRWVTPSFTFGSVVVGGAFDVDILDIDPTTYTLQLDPKALEAYDGVVITNLFGTHVDIDAWKDFCHTNNKVLIFDNASVSVSEYKGQKLCRFGDYSFGSLHHTKPMGFGEGGFAVVPAEQYDILNSINNFGFLKRGQYNPLSSNFKMSDISAAFIMAHLSNFSIEKHVNVQNKILDGIKEFDVEAFNYSEGVVYGNLPILFNRPVEIEDFKKYDIEVKKYYKPLLDLENSSNLYSKIINFPLYSTLEDGEINKIIDCIGKMQYER